ncbi:type II secretion system F family protein [Candidatus Parcubacteria bacterium]|nr:MAG: type II secretion system F family protein [Candidatus Parcubacteria bacterium]
MLYQFQAKKISGEEINSLMEASDKTDLAHRLRESGFVLISAKEQKEKSSVSANFLSKLGFVATADKIMFAKNLAVMIEAGLPITRALEILSRQTNNKAFGSKIIALMEDARRGDPLSEAMKKHPKIFSKLFVAMVKTGEESGRLSEALKMAGQQLEKDYVLMKRVKGAMMYPSIILAAMILIGIFMFIYVVPTLVSTFKEINIELPLSTKVIIFLSDSITNHTLLFILFLLAVVFSGIFFFRSEKGKIVLGNVLIKLPLISPVVKKINSARTSRTLASLISSGVNVIEALAITREVLQNKNYKEVLTLAISDVQKGAPVSGSFKSASKLYPVLMGEMIAVGEETGKIAEMLERLAVFYEDEVSEATKNMTTIIEPILMIFIGAAVGFFALSMIRPMYSMMNGI